MIDTHPSIIQRRYRNVNFTTILISFELDNSEHSCYNGRITAECFVGKKDDIE